LACWHHLLFALHTHRYGKDKYDDKYSKDSKYDDKYSKDSKYGKDTYDKDSKYVMQQCKEWCIL
jgi:hypothetical protein